MCGKKIGGLLEHGIHSLSYIRHHLPYDRPFTSSGMYGLVPPSDFPSALDIGLHLAHPTYFRPGGCTFNWPTA